ncbi:Calcium-binding mitochondrial carrier protein Aralar1 [Balamuthia mandrillaris]
MPNRPMSSAASSSSSKSTAFRHWLEVTGIGFVAGAAGQYTVYPYDTIKTRLQNQNKTLGTLYKHSLDCLLKIVKTEGILGLYKGVSVVALMTSPEKALKLGVNDFCRSKLARPDGTVSYRNDLLAGGTAGGVQLLLTCPMEIVKIRLQMLGQQQQPSSPASVSALGRASGPLTVIRELGVRGLYKGSMATWLRDIPFSMIYFPLYHRMKSYLKRTRGKVGPLELFVAGTSCGCLAAALVTPADVIKTRIQTDKTGRYHGTLDCIYQTSREGFSAFWKGTIPRLFTRGPQFGVTLLTYEALQKLFLGSVQSDHSLSSSTSSHGHSLASPSPTPSPLSPSTSASS